MTTTARPPEQQQVGDYELLALIGEGGMGVVHLARGADGRRVALKVLRPYIVGDREARERLAREVASLRLVSSPRVAEVLDADPHAETPYVATRYVPGLSLHEHVREEGPITGRDLLHFADCLAEALAAVHEVGVLHRDVKPSNVLMEGRSPVLIDFGLARLAEDPRLTHTGWLLGTPGYLAPEILYGDDASPASDVHAWAATVAFAASGRPPYGKGPAMAVMDRVRRGEFDLSGVPEPLRELLARALAEEPFERPSLFEVRRWIAAQRDQVDSAGPSAPEPWTMPVVALDRPAPTVVGDSPAVAAQPPATAAAPVPAGPAALPGPSAVTGLPGPSGPPVASVAEPEPVHTRVLPGPDPLPPGLAPAQPTPEAGSRVQRRMQVLALGAVTAALVAAAPYVGTMLVAVVVLALRTSSIGRERHHRRRTMRGRRRWFDVPVTTLSSPGYLALAALGTLLLVGWAIAAAVAFGAVEYLLRPPLPVALLLMGAVFTIALWWGPGALRLRFTVGGLAARASRHEYAGAVVAFGALVLFAVLLAFLLGNGPTWSPAPYAPWDHGVLATVSQSI